MSLLGTLDTLSLPDLFGLLAATSKTGALHVRGERGLGVVYFTAGKVCGGEAGEQSGPVEGRQALLARLHDVCFELFRFDEGSFEFENDRVPGWPAAGEVEVADLVAETNRRLGEWREILTVVPSVEVRPRLAPEPPSATVTLDRAQWRVITGIDGRRRVSALIRVLDGSEFEVCKTLKGLVEAGLVELDAEGQSRGDGAEAAGSENRFARVGAAAEPEPRAADGAGSEAGPRRDGNRRSARPVRAAAGGEESSEPSADTAEAGWDERVLAAAQANGTGEGLSPLEEAARAIALEEERRRTLHRDDAESDEVDEDGLNRGAVVAFLSKSSRQG